MRMSTCLLRICACALTGVIDNTHLDRLRRRVVTRLHATSNASACTRVHVYAYGVRTCGACLRVRLPGGNCGLPHPTLESLPLCTTNAQESTSVHVCVYGERVRVGRACVCAYQGGSAACRDRPHPTLESPATPRSALPPCTAAAACLGSLRVYIKSAKIK